MLIHSIQLQNFLSFGPNAETVPLGPLNVVIGPNGSGKSNLLEAFELLRNAPEQLVKPIREGGGVRDWLWKGSKETPIASISAVIQSAWPVAPHSVPWWERNNIKETTKLQYSLQFTEVNQHFEVAGETLGEKRLPSVSMEQEYYYRSSGGSATLNIDGEYRELSPAELDYEKSILSLRRDPERYPEITYLAQIFAKIRLYREWSFGRYTPPRLPQKADLPNNLLEPDANNLGLVLNWLRRDPEVKARLLNALRALYDGIDDYDVQIEGGTVQVFFYEGKQAIPATRLSDGTLRYLCLLAILCHPNPPPLVCIEEPELGLHPDILPTIAELLKEASERSQLIVTTHSDILVDAMTTQPETVLVCEKGEEGTVLRRLNKETLRPWLENYRLGELWTRGGIGGTRW